MTTPKQKRLRDEPKQLSDSPSLIPEMSVIDEDFDTLDEADAAFAQWRWPDRQE